MVAVLLSANQKLKKGSVLHLIDIGYCGIIGPMLNVIEVLQ